VLAAMRTMPAAVLLLVLVPVLRARLPRGRMAVAAALTGLLMVATFFYAVTEGTIRAGAGTSAVLVNTSPFFVLILGRIALGEAFSAVAAGGLVVGFGGVLLMVSSELGGGADVAVGIVLCLAAALAWAIGTLMIKALVGRRPDVDLVGFTAIQYVVGGAVLTVIALAADGTGSVQWASGELWVTLVYLVAGNAVVGSLAYFAALRRLSATRASAGLFLVPVVAVLVDVARGDAPTATVLLGMVLTIAGVAVVTLPGEVLARRTRRAHLT
jgi:drug/metabolite transporter (DMT)-like permease